MEYALFKVAVGTLFDHPETMRPNDEGQLVSTIGDEGLYGQACQVRTAPGGVTAEGVPLPEEMAEVVSFYGYHGYVFASELRFCGEAELRGYLAAEWVMAGRATDVLTLPKVQGVRLLELERGAMLRRLPEETPHDGWALVRLVDGRTGYVRAVALEPVRWPMTAVFTQQAGRRFDEALALAEGCRPEELVPRALDRWYGGSEEAFRNALAEQAKRYLDLGVDGVNIFMPTVTEESYRELVAAVDDLHPPFLCLQDTKDNELRAPFVKSMFDEFESFRCIKIETANPGPDYTAILKATDGRLNVSGSWGSDQMIEAFDRGIHALMPSGLFELFVNVYRLYHEKSREAAMKLFVGVDYDKRIELAPGIEVRFVDVGHLLGSASIELWITEGTTTTKLVFSGDIGNLDQPIIKDPTYIQQADYVFMESTYGDRNHDPRPDYVAELAKILQRTFDRGGNVVVPSFAVGRTQEMLYFLREIKEKGLVKGHGNFPVYIDSPLATEATRIFRDTDPDCFDAQTRALLEKGIDPINVPGLRISVTSDDSRMINTDRTPKVILSASGMCEAGRIRHHLKHNLWRPECTILFVGFQAVGTLGRTLIEGVDSVKLFGEPIEVKAEICQLTGMSGHADKDGLLRWVNAFTEKPRRVFVIHGEDEVENRFVATLTEQGFTACAPYNGAQWAIGAEGAVCLQEGTKVRVEQRTGEGTSRAATVFQRLVSAGKRLLRVIEHNEGGANKDLAKFADQINALCDKWDR